MGNIIVFKKDITAYMLLLISLILNDLINSIWFSVAILLYAAVLVIKYEPVFMIVPCFLTSTIQSYFLITPTLSFSRFLSLLFIGGYIIHRRVRVTVNRLNVFLAIFAFYHFLTIFWSVTGAYSEPISFVIGIIMMLFLDSFEVKKENVETLQKLMYYTCYLFGFFVVYLTIRLSSQIGVSQVVFDESLNANTICSTLALFVSVIYGKTLFGIGRKVFDYGFIILCIITILFAGSRTSLISVLGIIIILPFVTGESKKINMRKIVGVIIFATIAMGVLYYFVSNNSELYARFTFAPTTTVSIDRRIFVWEALWKQIIPNNLFLGIGYGITNVRYAVAPYVVMAFHSHNMFLGILSETGLVGLLLYSILYVWVFRCAYKSMDSRMAIAIGMILIGLIIGIGEEVINRRWFWIAVGLVFFFEKNRTQHPENSVPDYYSEGVK